MGRLVVRESDPTGSTGVQYGILYTMFNRTGSSGFTGGLCAKIAAVALVVAGGLPATASAQLGGDPIEELAAALADGSVELRHDSAYGYLPGLLEALDIPVSSQTLVFSRTSLQTQGIAPWAPRALYFNDDVYVGYVQESSFLEIASVHPTEGGVFYTLSQEAADVPHFQIETTSCLMCHESQSTTGGVPGFIVRSVLVDRLGYVVTDIHSGGTSDRTPMDRRWGGWYVTGTFDEGMHAGNTRAPELFSDISNARTYLESFDASTAANVGDLTDVFDPEPYLTPESDIVALMVLTHQAQVHNFIAMAHTATREALRDQTAARLSGSDVAGTDALTPTARVRIQGAANRLVREMLFSRSVPLATPVAGSTDFASEFAALGPTDSQGRSLRDLDLETRLFSYPLSFLVYSDAFLALPDVIRTMVFDRLTEVLTGADTSEDFAHLSEGDRLAILEILSETHPPFADHLAATAPSALPSR